MSTDSTLSLDELIPRTAALRERAGALGEYLDPPALEKRVAELERRLDALSKPAPKAAKPKTTRAAAASKTSSRPKNSARKPS